MRDLVIKSTRKDNVTIHIGKFQGSPLVSGHPSAGVDLAVVGTDGIMDSVACAFIEAPIIDEAFLDRFRCWDCWCWSLGSYIRD